MKTSWICWIACCLLAMEGCTSNHSISRTGSLDIFLLIGQSNMAGRGKMADLGTDTLPLTNVFLFNDSARWENARHPLNRFSTVRKDLSMQQVGMGYAFGQTLATQTGRTIGLVVNARGGTSIREWQPETLLYQEALKRARIAQKDGVLKAIIWHQGSSDKSHPETYTGLLRRMLDAFRRDLNQPDLPLFAGQLGYWRESTAPFNEMLTHIPDSIPHTYWISAEGLTPVEGDSLHFNAASQRVFGERYAQKVREVLYPKK